ncbi:hypothetical protein RBB79_09680 [Tunturiibacter empetritectus]|uniref:NHL repeat containing protein n=1 Tax=Tunturiibacter lichenicola TaxID=2051959 RepID=A0A852VF02_9BACT|nr:hypothetical protein [Edaphobacter lichenicola]NYF89821.1 hypothetical protein [Edaphobacter lichenicola]
MIGNSFARLTGSKRNLLALMASSAVFTAGCSNMATTATNTNPLSQAATLSGKIHGGNQPVVGATVSLYYAGLKGSPGTVPSVAATTTTDASGNFAFIKDPVNGNTDTGNTFSCPAGNNDPLVYVISKGGNTQNNGDTSQNNTAAAFISVYGTCVELTAANHVDMTEVTTVATMAAVQQFFNPTGGAIPYAIVSDGTGQQSTIIKQIPATIALLADSSAGTAVTSTTLNAASGNIAPGVSVTATPEVGKLNLLGNILSACINTATSGSAPCTSLFAAAVPPTSAYTNNFNTNFTAATDTLQAIYYILTNPSNGSTANVATLFGLAGGVAGPYQPAAATQPTDWTIAVSYSSMSTCGTSTGGSGGFISSPIDINIDAADNVWIANSQAGTGNLSEISGAGVPTTCVLLGSGGSQGGATIDSNNNVWIGSGASLYRYNPSNSTALAFPATVSPVGGVTADGVGNVYFTSVAGAVGSLYRIPNAAAATTAVTPIQISSNVGTNPVRLMPDYQGNAIQGNIFVTTGTTSVAEVSPSVAGGNLNGFLTSSIPTSGNSYGISLSHDNRLFVSSFNNGNIDGLILSAGTYTNLNGFPYNTPAMIGAAAPTSIAVDGRLNVWIPNNTNGTRTGSVSELGSQNIAGGLSPATGYQKDSTVFTSGRATAVDQAGNVWVAGDGANFITEIVGAGVPIYAPYAVGLKNGRFQTVP